MPDLFPPAAVTRAARSVSANAWTRQSPRESDLASLIKSGARLSDEQRAGLNQILADEHSEDDEVRFRALGGHAAKAWTAPPPQRSRTSRIAAASFAEIASYGTPRVHARTLGDGEAELEIFGGIGAYWEGVTVERVRQELKELGDDVETLHVRIDSPGGEVVTGMGIYNALKDLDAHVIVTIEALAASAAAFIAMAGDEIRIHQSAEMMIHNPWVIAWGEADDLRRIADKLDRTADRIIDILADRTGIDREEVSRLLHAETWLTANEAVAEGWADKVIPNKQGKRRAKKIAAVPENRDGDRTAMYTATAVARALSAIAGDDPTAESPPAEETSVTEDEFKAAAKKNPAWAASLTPTEATQTDAAEPANAAADTKPAVDTDAVLKAERSRCAELNKLFAADSKFLAEQIEAGHSVAEAKAAAYDAKVGFAAAKPLTAQQKTAADVHSAASAGTSGSVVPEQANDPQPSSTASADDSFGVFDAEFDKFAARHKRSTAAAG